MNRRTSAAVLGSADGVTSIAGVIAGGAAAGVGHEAVAVTAIGGALAATVSMAGAEMLSQNATDWEAIESMGAGTLLGSALPAVPLFVLTGPFAWVAVLGVAFVIAVVVGVVRHRTTDRPLVPAVALTLAVIAAGGAVGYGAGRFLS